MALEVNPLSSSRSAHELSPELPVDPVVQSLLDRIKNLEKRLQSREDRLIRITSKVLERETVLNLTGLKALQKGEKPFHTNLDDWARGRTVFLITFVYAKTQVQVPFNNS